MDLPSILELRWQELSTWEMGERRINDHSQLLIRATEESMLSFTNKGVTQGEGTGDRGAPKK